MLQISLEAGDHEPGRLEELLIEAGAQAVTLEDSADAPVYEPAPGETPLWPRTRVVGLFDAAVDVAAVQAALCTALGVEQLPGWRVEALADRDWERAWLESFRPMRFGRRLWVCPSEYPPPEPEAVNIRLDPGLAFGTGTHATTALCLEWLDSANLAGKRVLDYGCGSGILAIAAAQLGAHAVWAVDIDPQALTATRDNAARNGMADRVSTCLPEELPAMQVDVLLANILAGPLVELAPRLVSLLRPDATLVLSGILEDQAASVMGAYREFCSLAPPVARDGWVRLVGVKRP
jgi:ribosomal protein L11 methyltransferase